MALDIDTRKSGNVTILDVSGKLALGKHGGELREKIRDLLTEGEKRILLNLKNVDYVDSAGLAELVSGFTAAKARGGALKLLNVQKRVSDVIRITRLNTVLESFTNETEALRSFEG